MKMIKRSLLFFIAFVAITSLTSALPASKINSAKPVVTTPIVSPPDSRLSYKELKALTTTIKGSKLSLKERIALKLFGKKIISKGSVPFSGNKSQLVALLLCFFVGGLGIHRFYLGYTWQGIVQLLTAGGCGIWALIDFIRIITGSLKPRDGEYTSTL
jgi:TM2 domain-containing membrane protein YozV